MRSLLAILGLLLCLIATRADEPRVIKDSEAIHYVGKNVEVRGSKRSFGCHRSLAGKDFEPRLELTVSKLLVQEREELLLLVWADVIEVIDCFGLFEPAEIFFVVRQARIIKNDHLDRMAITPEMLVVRFNGCADIA